VNAAGAENLALALDSNLTRIAELANGERFTAETAFHMEATLGLPHGFFD
jgi:plasmid maintenance system antidote protein VapI